MVECGSMFFRYHDRYILMGCYVTDHNQIPNSPTCEIPLLIANLVSSLGLKVEDRGAGSDMVLRAWDRLVLSFIVVVSCLMFRDVIFTPQLIIQQST